MAPISITFATSDGGACMQSVEATATPASVREALAPLLSIPAAQQSFVFNGSPLSPTVTFADANVCDGDLVLVERAAGAPSPSATHAQPQHAGSGPAHGAGAGAGAGAPGAAEMGAQMLAAVQADPAALERLRSANPPMYQAVRAGNSQEVARLMQAAMGGGNSGAREPNMDPMSEEGQKAMAEKIRLDNVMENFETAYERNPESFGQVTMLFVDAKINNIPVTAFCDSGAQATILSAATAERCNILRLLDTRFAGVAHGVGTAKILGRIHLALLHIGDAVLETTFTVMEDSTYDMLLGLDMMRRHQACIDLRKNVLQIGDATVEFLPEHRIPKSMMRIGGGGAGDEPGPSTSAAGSGSAARQTANSTPTARGNTLGGGRGGTNRAAPAAAGLAAASRAGADNDKINKLVELGFSRSDAAQALQACDGNEDQAAAMLSQAKYGF